MLTTREGGAIAKKQLLLRDHLWPNAAASIWHRTANKGFATIPKTMPLILKIMDEMTKGAPVSSTYMTLWCSTWDNGFIHVIKPQEMAFTSGFGGQRGEHTWAARMKTLQSLQFIDIKAGKSGPMTHALIHNPHLVIRWHYENKTPGIVESSYTALIERALEVGAKDMFPPEIAPPPPAIPVPPPPAAPTPVTPGNPLPPVKPTGAE